jgi:hypothetical protein
VSLKDEVLSPLLLDAAENHDQADAGPGDRAAVADRQRPTGEAIGIAALETVDWSRVDLSEWGPSQPARWT